MVVYNSERHSTYYSDVEKVLNISYVKTFLFHFLTSYSFHLMCKNLQVSTSYYSWIARNKKNLKTVSNSESNFTKKSEESGHKTSASKWNSENMQIFISLLNLWWGVVYPADYFGLLTLIRRIKKLWNYKCKRVTPLKRGYWPTHLDEVWFRTEWKSFYSYLLHTVIV